MITTEDRELFLPRAVKQPVYRLPGHSWLRQTRNIHPYVTPNSLALARPSSTDNRVPALNTNIRTPPGSTSPSIALSHADATFTDYDTSTLSHLPVAQRLPSSSRQQTEQSQPSQPMSPPHRRRTGVACSHCRKRKIKVRSSSLDTFDLIK
jgi:hypothetical protein